MPWPCDPLGPRACYDVGMRFADAISRLTRLMSVAIVAVGLSGRGAVTADDKPAPRPERSAEDRAARAAELRRIYAGDPATWPAPHVDEGVAWREIGL